MRGFIVLCFAAVAVAAPQGYNYNAASGFSGGSPGSIGGGSLGGSGGFGGHSVGGHQQQPVVSKHFFIHSVPEENDGGVEERHITVGVPRKNYNVVFIKSPQSSQKKVLLKISPSVNEEKTAIYVLKKNDQSADIQTQVVENSAPTHKPEVFYIKYKTNEEANHAQQQIQAQYDALGGSSQVSNEGTIPASSVIGSLGGGSAGNGGHGLYGPPTFGSGVGSTAISPGLGSSYLPPIF